MSPRKVITPQETIARGISEATLQNYITFQAAEVLGWTWYHTHDSRKSPGGFPDLFMAHPKARRSLHAELKTELRELTREQVAWGIVLLELGEFYIWRPRDWLSGLITDVLQGVRLDQAREQTSLELADALHRSRA